MIPVYTGKIRILAIYKKNSSKTSIDASFWQYPPKTSSKCDLEKDVVLK
ncbi:MAG: hypothetical protein V3581_00955 [Candidatus Cardinium sp.]